MKAFLYKRILPIILSISIVTITFFTYSVPVYAVQFMPTDIVAAIEYGIANNDWEPFWYFLNESKDGLMYLYSQMGAFVTKDFQAWVNNNNALESLANTEPARKEGNNITFTKEFMTQLKALLDEYAKQNEPYRIVQVSSYKDLDPANYSNKGIYNTICNLAKEHGLISVNINYIANLSDVYDNGYSFVKYYEDGDYLEAFIYDSNWEKINFEVRRYIYSNEPIVYTTFDQLDKDYSKIHDIFAMNDVLLTGKTFIRNQGSSYGSLISRNGGRIRVYNTLDDYKRYSVGKRNVYYTNNYYNYVPDDLTVSIDDLQKSVDDLQKVIDDLLDRITDRTDESEIEELLRQILEALKNQQGTGSGSQGGGNVTVNVDMATTNNLLSKIYAKVSEISEKISSSAGQSMTEVVESIENLGKMLKKYLSEITGDLDDIKDQLEEISEQEFSDKTDDFLDDTTESFSEIAEVAKNKFPLSIPYDLKNLFTVISPKPPEPNEASLYSADQMVYNAQTATIYEGNGKALSVREGSADAKVAMSSTGAPVFNLPIVVKSVGWDYTIVADMSQFQTVANLSRTMFTLIFILGIIKLSIAVIGLWGDIVD